MVSFKYNFHRTIINSPRYLNFTYFNYSIVIIMIILIINIITSPRSYIDSCYMVSAARKAPLNTSEVFNKVTSGPLDPTRLNTNH